MTSIERPRESWAGLQAYAPAHGQPLNAPFGTCLLRVAGHASAWRHYRRLMLEDTLPHEVLLALQERRIGRLLRHAYDSVAHYRDVMDHLGLDPARESPGELLLAMPPLMKADIVANFPDRILSHGRRGIAAQHLASTGTTADRVDVVVSAAAQASRLALVLWRLNLAGACPTGKRRVEIPPDVCSRLCGSANGRPVSLADELRYAFGNGGAPLREAVRAVERRLRRTIRHGLIFDLTLPPFGPEGTNISDPALERYVAAIRAERPYLVTGFPAYLQQIARHLERNGEALGVPVVHPMGGLSTPRLREEVGRAFGAEVYETYGSSELGGFSCQCPERHWLHVAMGAYVVEVLRDGCPAREGELGHIAVTGLDNLGMPLIRYRLGDVGRWHAGPCACGRESQLIECNGRVQDLIVTSQGSPVTEEDAMNLAYHRLGLDQFQLVERRRGDFDLTVVPARGQELDTAGVTAAFAGLLDHPRRLRVSVSSTIYPEATGKFRFVKSASYEDFA